MFCASEKVDCQYPIIGGNLLICDEERNNINFSRTFKEMKNPQFSSWKLPQND